MSQTAAGILAPIRTVPGRLWWDTIRLRVPLLGDALRKAETARFARAMGTLVAASVPLVQSIGISRGILNNRRIAGSLEAVARSEERRVGKECRSRRSPYDHQEELTALLRHTTQTVIETDAVQHQ